MVFSGDESSRAPRSTAVPIRACQLETNDEVLAVANSSRVFFGQFEIPCVYVRELIERDDGGIFRNKVTTQSFVPGMLTSILAL